MLNPEEFTLWQHLVVDLAGLYIVPEKAYLFETRLKPLILSSGLSLPQIYELAKAEPESGVALQVIELMTTHETSFFRDHKPFDLFRYLLEALIKVRRREEQRLITVFSAGCSTGEEPYSIAMVLAETMRFNPGFRFNIQACDIAEPTLDRARRGFYVNVEKNVRPDLVRRYFQPEGKGWRVVEKLRDPITFEQCNLLKLKDRGETFDFVFCRNVAIYFERSVRLRLFEQLAHRLKPGGSLMVGASESLNGVDILKRHEGPGGFYFKRRDE